MSVNFVCTCQSHCRTHLFVFIAGQKVHGVRPCTNVAVCVLCMDAGSLILCNGYNGAKLT